MTMRSHPRLATRRQAAQITASHDDFAMGLRRMKAQGIDVELSAVVSADAAVQGDFLAGVEAAAGRLEHRPLTAIRIHRYHRAVADAAWAMAMGPNARYHSGPVAIAQLGALGLAEAASLRDPLIQAFQLGDSGVVAATVPAIAGFGVVMLGHYVGDSWRETLQPLHHRAAIKAVGGTVALVVALAAVGGVRAAASHNAATWVLTLVGFIIPISAVYLAVWPHQRDSTKAVAKARARAFGIASQLRRVEARFVRLCNEQWHHLLAAVNRARAVYVELFGPAPLDLHPPKIKKLEWAKTDEQVEAEIAQAKKSILLAKDPDEPSTPRQSRPRKRDFVAGPPRPGMWTRIRGRGVDTSAVAPAGPTPRGTTAPAAFATDLPVLDITDNGHNNSHRPDVTAPQEGNP